MRLVTEGICICGIPGTQSEMGLSPYSSWFTKRPLKCTCVAVWVLIQYPLFQTWEYSVHHYILSEKVGEACYFNYSHNKRQQPIVSLGRGQGTVMGVEKKVYTLLIWTLVLVLSLSFLPRASIQGIASIAMNSILPTTTTNLWLVISAREL